MIRNKDINYVPRPNERPNNAGVAFDNPVYNIENDIRNDSLYDETPPNHIVEDENYLDLQ